jgi:pilus assembly protein FimV
MDLDSLDSGDMDLAALDEEVDALAGNLDLASEEFGDEFGDEAAEPADLSAADLSLDDALALDDSLETEVSEDSVEEPVELADEASLMEEPLSDFGDLSPEEPAAEEDAPAMEFDAGAESLDDFSLDLSEELSDAEAPAEEALVENTEAEAATEEEPEFDIAADLGIDLDAEPEAETEDDVFDAALSDIPTSDAEDLAADDIMDEDLDAELDFLADTDEAATKLDLARAYIDMGDKDGAKDILGEVVAEGNADQKKDAEELLSRIN